MRKSSILFLCLVIVQSVYSQNSDTKAKYRLELGRANPHAGGLNKYLVDSLFLYIDSARYPVDKFDISFIKADTIFQQLKINNYRLTSVEDKRYYETLFKMWTNDKILFHNVYYGRKYIDIRDSIFIR